MPGKSRTGGPSAKAGASGVQGLKQVSLARLSEFGILPKRRLGQNFLVDDNIVGVILRLLDSSPDDVVLEVGAGLGVLTAALANVAGHVHAFEVDRSLGPALAATLGDAGNVTLYFEDILAASLEQLSPAPTLCASNLPYGVAGAFLVEALCRLPSVRRYCVMVQREVADRMVASPGSRAYGMLSVWVQLYSEIRHVRSLPRSIFVPRPNVDSSLVVLDRLPAHSLPVCGPAALQRVLQAAFGQRRKTLVNALSSGLELSRESGAQILAQLGLPEDVRAERLTPSQLAALATLLQGISSEPTWHSAG